MSDVDGIAKRMYWITAIDPKGEVVQPVLFGFSEEELVELLERNGFSKVRAIPAGRISHRHIENLD